MPKDIARLLSEVARDLLKKGVIEKLRKDRRIRGWRICHLIWSARYLKLKKARFYKSGIL